MTLINDRLMYRRQFFLGPKYIEELADWKHTQLNSKYFITSHPDLALNIASLGKTSLILLGFIFDPDNPSFGNIEILNELLLKGNNFEDVIENTERYSGRWVLIHSIGNEINLFTDACGARSVFYYFNNEVAWCSSQPHTLANLLDVKYRDDKEFLEFINSKAFDKNERTLFGEDTLFKEVYHLLPNHYLSISEKCVKRYWPYKASKQLNVEQAIKVVAPMLKGLYQSANNRYKLIQPVTSGRDTRLLLAASKDVRANVYYFIQKFNKLRWYSKDIRLPNKLLKYLGLEFHVIKCSEYDLEFDKYLRKNVYMLQSESKKILLYNFFQNYQDCLNVSGNYTGIYRPFKWQVFAPLKTPLINRTFGRYFRKNKYVVDYVKNWENEYYAKLSKYKYPIIDVFYWENKAANWVSMFLNELDISNEEWCPLNNRKILETILSIDPAIRINENFQQQIVEYLWQDVLHEPLAKVGEDNQFKIHYKKIIYKLLQGFGLLNFVKRFYNKHYIV